MKKKLFYVFIFGIAFALVEASVVVYLRALYYPEGFAFPLKIISPEIYTIEFFREIATMLMLLSIAWTCGKNFNLRIAFFVFAFGIWDIFYYVFLKILLNWPSSLLTWDLLFLIPVAWVGPVLAPVLCSLTMLLMAGLIFYFQQRDDRMALSVGEWCFILAGSFVIFLVFIYDYAKFLITGGFYRISDLFQNQKFMEAVQNFAPQKFYWLPFFAGEILILTGLFLFFKKGKKLLSK